MTADAPRTPPLPTHDEIIRAVKGTGFLFEQQVSEKIPGSVTGWAFRDQDTGTSREIDVYKQGHSSFFDGAFNSDIEWHLVVSCKNYRWPWVVLTKDWEDSNVDIFGLNQEIDLTVSMRIALGAESNINSYFDPENFFKRVNEIRFADEKLGVQLLRLRQQNKAWEASTESIFDTITYPLAKAADWLTRAHRSRHADVLDAPPRSLSAVFPVLAVSTPIYAIEGASENPTVQQVDHVCLERTLNSETISGKFRVHVVHIDSLESWYQSNVLGMMRFVAHRLGQAGRENRMFDRELFHGQE